ncbi:MAG: DUF952 domain-containing protein [Ignavibacteria bacterium]|nr:DUF952 domain-containing protein [Ignavibacteria bacterium]
MEIIYHLTIKKDRILFKKTKPYRTASLDTEGFIHCSPKDKVRSSAAKFFNKEKEILLIYIDQSKVSSEIIWEDSNNDNFLFPHIYGELNLEAVIEIYEIVRDEDGIFVFPEDF